MRLVGRSREQHELQHFVDSPRSEFVVIFGRRRVGKTTLVREFFGNEFAFYATGVAGGSMRDQLDAFNITLRRAGGTGGATGWFEAFEQMCTLLESPGVARDVQSGKIVVFIDEMPWLDTPRSRFLPALEFFWNSWASARDDVLLIACGSATSWVIKNLFENHGGLHNRVTGRIHLEPFTLGECEELYRSNGIELSRVDIIESYMVFGGVPFYLELMDKRLGLAQNIDRLCFAKSGQLHDEFNHLYRSLFKNAGRHISVVRALAKKQEGLHRGELLQAVGESDGGTFSTTLSELEQCGFVRRYRDFTKKSREDIYQLIDPFTLFWLRFVEAAEDEHWWSANRNGARVRSWSGRAFELVCLLHAQQMLAALGVWGISANVCAWRSRNSDPGAQIDLLLDRADNVVNLCEMKFSQDEFEITKSYDAALRHKVEAFSRETKTRKALHLTLVTPYGLKRNAYSNNVQVELTADDLFR